MAPYPRQAFKRPASLLNAADRTEETWRARSLLQLITDVMALHRPRPTGSAPPGGDGAKRQKTTANTPLPLMLTDAICAPRSPEQLARWLLLAGSLAERHPSALDEPTRAALLGALRAALPSADGLAGGTWAQLPLLAWCLGNLATISSPRGGGSEWVSVWDALHALVALCTPSAGAAASGGSTFTAGRAVHSSFSSSTANSWEQLCFIDLAARCLRILLDRQAREPAHVHVPTPVPPPACTNAVPAQPAPPRSLT